MIWLTLAGLAGCGQLAPVPATPPSKPPVPRMAIITSNHQASSEAKRQQAEAEARKASRHAQSAAKAAEKASAEAVEASKRAQQAAARAIGPTPSAAPAPATSTIILSSASDDAVEKNRTQSKALVERLTRTINGIDRSKLNADGEKRAELAQELLHGAQKALGEEDYVAANSLASKASVMLAPLMDRFPESYQH